MSYIDCMLLMSLLACSPDQLSDTYGESVRDDIVCGASYTALGTENGFVCYSGTKVGSTAMHYCYDCGFNSVRESTSPVIRTCGRNGQWNGSIPQCDCSKYKGSYLKFNSIVNFMPKLKN